jgi:small subunit ribosomal protein S6
MPSNPSVYDLVLLLSMNGEDDVRTKLVADVEARIPAGGGSITLKQAWGRRPTTFRIDHQTEAEYHLIQFTGPASLLDSLSHSLGIADEVLRYRIIKNVPGTPPAPDSPPPVLAAGQGVTAEAEPVA